MTRLFRRSAIALAACLCASGAIAASSAQAQEVQTFIAITKPAANTPILVVMPTVELSLLTAAGTSEPKDDWSQSAQKFLDASLTDAIKARSYAPVTGDVSSYDDPSALQLVKLNQAVTDTIMMNGYAQMKLPTKTTFDYTLGTNAAKLIPASTDASATPPAYGLFLHAIGRYSSGGRAAMMVGMAMLGVGMPMGGQAMQATLVDLKTGQVVWYQVSVVAPGTDIRTAEGAATATAALLKKLPL